MRSGSVVRAERSGETSGATCNDESIDDVDRATVIHIGSRLKQLTRGIAKWALLYEGTHSRLVLRDHQRVDDVDEPITIRVARASNRGTDAFVHERAGAGANLDWINADPLIDELDFEPEPVTLDRRQEPTL